jgi:hypothetical protein
LTIYFQKKERLEERPADEKNDKKWLEERLKEALKKQKRD